MDPPIVPEWLHIPYLVPVKGVSREIIPDGCANSCIQHGDQLYRPDNDAPVGTLGTVMVSNGIYVVLTAGHIIPGGLHYLTVQRHDRSTVYLKVANLSIRYQDRFNEPTAFQDDCAFLFIDRFEIGRAHV